MAISIKVLQTPPNGPITDADPPIPVTARISWTIKPKDLMPMEAWAMAWTKTEVLVYWRSKGVESGVLAWIEARHVRRR